MIFDDALPGVDQATASLMPGLGAEHLTVKEAVAETMAGLAPGPAWGTVLKCYPEESGDQPVMELIKRFHECGGFRQLLKLLSLF